jgi:hypothetical protein
MTKQQYAIRHGLTVRPVTEADRREASTDYQRKAKYIIDDGLRQWYSLRGTLEDMRDMVAARKRYEEDGIYV